MNLPSRRPVGMDGGEVDWDRSTTRRSRWRAPRIRRVFDLVIKGGVDG